MEYVGDPLEKLLGFFIAVVILTFYIGIVNLALMFVSFSVFQSSAVGYSASFIGVIPVWFYAQYRARRYVLGRTRWRGVRFGLEKGAWGYAWRALVHWFITIVSMGLLWPRMTFWLEKYKTDRTFFGSAKLEQGGKWWMLYRAAWPFALGVIAAVLWLFGALEIDPLLLDSDDVIGGLDVFSEDGFPFNVIYANLERPVWLFMIFPILLLVIYGAVHYRFASKRIMADHKHAVGVRMGSRLNSLRISVIYVLGTTIAYALLAVGLLGIIGAGIGLLGTGALLDAQIGTAAPFGAVPQWLSAGILAALYLSVFLFWSVLHNVFVTYPLMRHMAATLSLHDLAGLADVSQRARDEFAEAEGFAEALDLGAAI